MTQTKKLEILVVEDNPENLQNAIEYLTERPYIKLRRRKLETKVGLRFIDSYIRSNNPHCDDKTEDGYDNLEFEEQKPNGEVYEIVVRTAKTYDDASRILRENDSIVNVMTDMNFPRSEGKEPEELGYELIDRELEPRAMNYVILTTAEVGPYAGKGGLVFIGGKEAIARCRKEGRSDIGHHGRHGSVKTKGEWDEALEKLFIQTGVASGEFESESTGLPEYRSLYDLLMR